jgi:TolA-binding protein
VTDQRTAPLDDIEQEPGHRKDGKRRRWLAPTITGVVAFLLGIAAGGDGEDLTGQVQLLEAELATTESQLEDKEAEAADLADNLEATEQTLSDAMAGLEERQAELDDLTEATEAQQAKLDDRQAALDDREAGLDDREADLDVWESTIEQQSRTGGSASSPSTNDTGSSSSSTSVYYENCDAARAAGAAPVRRGDPGYAPHLDRDNDGVGCE